MKTFSFRDDDATVDALQIAARNHGLPVAVFMRLVARAYLRNPSAFALLGAKQEPAPPKPTAPKPNTPKPTAPKPNTPKPELSDAARKQILAEWGGDEGEPT